MHAKVAKKRYGAEDIITKLREAEVMFSQGISDQTYF